MCITPFPPAAASCSPKCGSCLCPTRPMIPENLAASSNTDSGNESGRRLVTWPQWAGDG
ncbi:hypothetical protein HanIR_Chr14g0728211 [Helianthus annuus]|nr:hypothetical protein HanIR_Chr14g0728211 [Helianthus annuus]